MPLALVAFLTCLLSAVTITPVFAQQADDRYEALKAVPRMINDPDPLRRIVNLEAIVAEGDQLKTELAIRAAMGVEDDQLRAVATKAYLSRITEVVFNWELPEAVASKAEPDPARLSRSENQLYQDHIARGGKIPVRFNDIDRTSGFTVEAYGGLFSGAEGNILGQRLVFRPRVQMAGGSRPFCTFDINPTPDLMLKGTMLCEQYVWGAPMNISAAMY